MPVWICAYVLWEFVLINHLYVILFHYICSTTSIIYRDLFSPKEQLHPQQGVCECIWVCWCMCMCGLVRKYVTHIFYHSHMNWTNNRVFHMFVFTQVCVTDQCAESLGWVSTGDPRGVNSDLHHLFHVGRWRLTCVKLPSWPSFRVPQISTQIKLTSNQ